MTWVNEFVQYLPGQFKFTTNYIYMVLEDNLGSFMKKNLVMTHKRLVLIN